MLFDDSYRTIEVPAEGEFKDRSSKFHAFAYPIATEADVKPLLDALREQHPKAGHHCYAYRLGLDRNQFRANDDGEPSGTAGRPILNTLYSRDLTDLLVVVVRYFGGTLLGVPGLINAYKSATEAALDQAPVVTRYVCDAYEITFPYDATSEVNRLLKLYGLEATDPKFGEDCSLVIQVRKTLLNAVVPAFEGVEGVGVRWLG